MNKRPLNSLSKKEFEKLKSMGFLWEFYPDAPENYEEINGTVMNEIYEIRLNYCTCEQERKCSTCYVTEEICEVMTKKLDKIGLQNDCDCYGGRNTNAKLKKLIKELKYA